MISPTASPSIGDVIDQAQPGDVLLVTPCDRIGRSISHMLPLARLIRELTDAPVSHAILVIDDDRFVDIRASRDPNLDDGSLSELAETIEFRSCWLLRHRDIDDRREFEAAMVSAMAEVRMSLAGTDFAVAELVKGLLLLLALRDGPTIIGALGLRDEVRALAGGSPKRVFCSELTFRSFERAAEASGKPGYAIDCSDLILRQWVRLFDSKNRASPQPLEVEEGSILAQLSDAGKLAEFNWTVTKTGAPWSGGKLDPSLADETLELLRRAQEDPTTDIADFVTPRDLLYSPSLEPVARWGLGMGETLTPWRCPEPAPGLAAET